MGRSTGISWTRSTRNFWSGCTKVGPGCDGCYAEAFNRWTRGKNEETGEATNWGPGAPRIPHLYRAPLDLLKWNGICAKERETGRVIKKDWDAGWKHAGYWPVFINSHSDFFDNEVPQGWRDEAIPVMEQCTNLTFFLVTKRIGNVAKMVPESWMRDGFPPHVRLIITVVNEEEAQRDVPKLQALPCKNGISYEPALGPVDWYPYLVDDFTGNLIGGPCTHWRAIEWIIIGGESDQAGHKTRPFDVEWARSTIAQCRDAGVAVFVKQLGSDPTALYERVQKDRAGADPAEWPEDLRVQEFPV